MRLVLVQLLWIFGIGFLRVNAQESPLRVLSSQVEFSIKNAGLTVKGTVGGISANIYWSYTHVDQCRIVATAKVETLETGLKARDRHLMKEEYFHLEAFPYIKLQSKSISRIAPGKYEGIFDLQIKGTTRTVVLPFAHDNGTFIGSFSINRLDYQIGSSSWILSDDVNIVVKVVCQKP